MSEAITLKSGQTLSQLAVKYNTTVEKILEANPNIKNAEKIQAGAKINIPINGNNSSSPVDSAEINKTSEQKKGEEIVKQIKAYGYAENYDVKAEADGTVVVTLKKDVQIADIKEQLGLEKGVLRNTNPNALQNSKKPIISVHSDEQIYNDDNLITLKGTTLRFEPASLKPKDPEDTFWNALKSAVKEAWNNL